MKWNLRTNTKLRRQLNWPWTNECNTNLMTYLELLRRVCAVYVVHRLDDDVSLHNTSSTLRPLVHHTAVECPGMFPPQLPPTWPRWRHQPHPLDTLASLATASAAAPSTPSCIVTSLMFRRHQMRLVIDAVHTYTHNRTLIVRTQKTLRCFSYWAFNTVCLSLCQ